ncbi:phage portal protein [Clostridium perfringens]|uniref:phage portal protein n=1 Tax=Clostridium perfringens TaxID=1502 RepID=UPI0013E2D789|nr:phage portal protein [Clostridium perfringens]EJT6497561.1 phage portal protein [Clostridium perfringens]NGT47722.1 phage portal protein [Clostridium perfringens]UUR80142.1 phage portal protein [Clostridium perfringens]BDA34831.1 phage-like protein [Clostridium perfringens]HCG3017403.1 phage portal protein [Clostridium perfringens]
MFWDKIEHRNTEETIKKYTFSELINNGFDSVPDIELKETTYFKCIKYISESVAKCPIVVKQNKKDGEYEAYNHSLYEKLRLRPNPYMTAIDCIKALVVLGEHFGIGGLYIDRINNDLYPVKIRNIIIDDNGLLEGNLNKVLVEFNMPNQEGSCFDRDIILYKPGISFDGIRAKATKELLWSTLKTNLKGQNYLGKLFDNGLTNKILIQLASDIKDEKELKKIQAKFKRLYDNDGRFITAPAGYKLETLNLSLADAQFEQIRKLSRREIANCFGLSPSQIGDLEDSNNNNMEMQNLSFLTDTLLIKFQQIEQELDWKYLSTGDRKNGFKCRFKQEVMLRTDPKTQSEIINSYVQSGVYSLNDAKSKLGIPKVEGGDSILVPSGYYKLEDLSKITVKKGGGGDE